MIRLVGYLVADVSMQQAPGVNGWFTIYEPPPNLSASQALERLAARMRTWERRLQSGSFNGVTKVALESHGFDAGGVLRAGVLVLEVRGTRSS